MVSEAVKKWKLITLLIHAGVRKTSTFGGLHKVGNRKSIYAFGNSKKSTKSSGLFKKGEKKARSNPFAGASGNREKATSSGQSVNIRAFQQEDRGFES